MTELPKYLTNCNEQCFHMQNMSLEKRCEATEEDGYCLQDSGWCPVNDYLENKCLRTSSAKQGSRDEIISSRRLSE